MDMDMDATLGDRVPPSDGPATDTSPRAAAAAPSALTWWLLGLCVAAVIASGLQIWSGQTSRGFYLLTLCFLVCGVGAWIDVGTRRIPNVLTYPAILIGLVLNALAPPLLHAVGGDVAVVWLGSTGVRDGMLGFGLCAAIGIVSFIARGLGGGDVKLLGAVGAMLGLHAVVAVLFNTLAVAAVIALANWAAQGIILARVQRVAGRLLSRAVGGRDLPTTPFKHTEAPFGVALLIGLALAQFVALHRVLLDVIW